VKQRGLRMNTSEHHNLTKDVMNKLRALSTCTLSDALDRVGLSGVVLGIRPTWPDCPRIAGTALTIKLGKAGDKPAHTGLLEAVDMVRSGDIIIIDNRGTLNINSWGGILTFVATKKGAEGAVIDGATRDLDDIRMLKFPVYARSIVPTTARGRVQFEGTNVPVQCGDVRVAPGDVVVADENGVVIMPASRMNQVLEVAEKLAEIESAIIEDVKKGISATQAHARHRYEDLTKR